MSCGCGELRREERRGRQPSASRQRPRLSGSSEYLITEASRRAVSMARAGTRLNWLVLTCQGENKWDNKP
jgi:hypothetical protein